MPGALLQYYHESVISLASEDFEMQAFVEVSKQPEYKTLVSTAQHIINTRGVTSLWSGLAPRLFRLCSAFIILQVARSELINLVEGSRALQTEGL